MSKQATARKLKPKQSSEINTTVHDIINKVKDSHSKMDKRLEELAQMCSPRELRIK